MACSQYVVLNEEYDEVLEGWAEEDEYVVHIRQYQRERMNDKTIWRLTCRYLVTNGRQHETEGREELGSSGIELCNHGWHIPLKLAPDIAVGRRDEDRSQGAQGSDDGKSEELIIPGQIVFGKSSKIGEVDGHAAEQSDDDVQGRES